MEDFKYPQGELFLSLCRFLSFLIGISDFRFQTSFLSLCGFLGFLVGISDFRHPFLSCAMSHVYYAISCMCSAMSWVLHNFLGVLRNDLTS